MMLIFSDPDFDEVECFETDADSQFTQAILDADGSTRLPEAWPIYRLFLDGGLKWRAKSLELGNQEMMGQPVDWHGAHATRKAEVMSLFDALDELVEAT